LGNVDLNSIVLTQTDYADEIFKDVGQDHDELVSSEFYDCVFLRCSLVESVFRKCHFVNCAFRECDLSLVRVPDSRFTSTQFENSKVVGVNWTEADWPQAGLGTPVGFLKSAISHSTFIGLSLSDMEIRDCVATDVDFREANLSRAVFAGTDLARSLFSSTDLSEADLSRARNYQIDPGQNRLEQARFSMPEAMSLLYSLDIVLVEED
jgi:fluoroquinolone resistance protein